MSSVWASVHPAVILRLNRSLSSPLKTKNWTSFWPCGASHTPSILLFPFLCSAVSSLPFHRSQEINHKNCHELWERGCQWARRSRRHAEFVPGWRGWGRGGSLREKAAIVAYHLLLTSWHQWYRLLFSTDDTRRESDLEMGSLWQVSRAIKHLSLDFWAASTPAWHQPL